MIALWNRPAFDNAQTPFEHVCVDDFLPADLFAALAAAFPECPEASGPTGFTIHPGDPAFDALMARDARWAAFKDSCDSPEFMQFVLRQFRDCFAREAVVDLGAARHVRYQESRRDKESAHIAHVEHAADALWVRFDLMQGRVGYQRAVHVDHRRRVATMLVYFSEAEESPSGGGDLQLHASREAPPVKIVTPRPNRMVMFPCSNSSWHSVSRIVHQQMPRNFVQVTLSSSVDLWQPMPKSTGMRLRDMVRSVKGALRV